MTKKKDRSQGFFGMGTALLLTVFLVLMLVTFSLLSLSTARNDLNRSKMLAQRRTDFYNANNQAEDILHALQQGNPVPEFVTLEGDFAEFTIETGSGQTLFVNLQLQNGIWRALRWEIHS